MADKITQHLIDSCIYLAILDDEFLTAARTIVPPNLFGSKTAETILNLCYRFYDEHGEPPKEHYQDEFATILSDKDSTDRKNLIRYSQRIADMPEPNKKYVISRLHDLVRHFTYEKSAVKIAEFTRDGRYDEAQKLFYDATRSGFQKENIGLDYLTDTTVAARRNEIPETLFPTGWDVIDHALGGGYQRGWLCVFLGKYKGKKSWAMTAAAVNALKHGLTVVHVSHENSLEETERRYDRAIGSLTRWTDDRNVEAKFYNKRTGLIDREEIKRPSVYDTKEVLKSRKALRRFGGRLIIKKYPMGSANAIELQRYLDYLEKFHSVVPDVLINDYADIMAPVHNRDSTRDQINETYLQLKRIADERNILVLNPSQATRKAIEKPIFSQQDFAEDIRKLANCDLCIAVGSTPSEKDEEISRAVLLAARDAPDGIVGCVFGSNLDMGQFITWQVSMKEFENPSDEPEKDYSV